MGSTVSASIHGCLDALKNSGGVAIAQPAAHELHMEQMKASVRKGSTSIRLRYLNKVEIKSNSFTTSLDGLNILCIYKLVWF